MENNIASPVDRPTAGLVLVVCLGGLGAATLALGLAYGAPTWAAAVAVPLGLMLLALYVGLVFVPQRTLAGRMTTAQGQRGQAERAFIHALEHLQAGDVADTLGHAEELPDEFASAFSSAARALGALVQQIQNSSIEVAGAGSGVQATASELASGSSEQAAAVVEITATMEELARTAAQIAANAATQAEAAGQAEQSGNVGLVAVEQAVAGVEEVLKRIAGIAARADTLGTRSKEIYRVLDLITEIAQETHILSLNAAIEAAAAGEHGRRFSVVADEVRRLAQRSGESAESVRSLLDEFSGSIRATVVATEEGSKEAERVLERARAAAAAIEELRGALSDTARAAREISLATQQQRTASDQVVLTLKEVSQVIQRMAEGLKQFSITADRLNQLALSIQLLTQSFHLDSPRSLKHLAERLAHELAARAGHWEAVEAQLSESVQANQFLEMAYLVDAQGNMMAFSVNRDVGAQRETPAGIALGINFADRPWFQAVTRDGRSILTPLYDSLLTGDRCFTVAAPVHDGDGRIAAVLGFDVNARNWTKI